MNPRCSPSRVLNHHPEDQFPKFLRGLPSPNLRLGTGDQAPVQAETGPVPQNYSLGCNHDQRSFPSRPEPTGGDPEELVERTYSWPRMSTLQHGELLAKGKILEEEASTRPPEANQRSPAQDHESKHGHEL